MPGCHGMDVEEWADKLIWAEKQQQVGLVQAISVAHFS